MSTTSTRNTVVKFTGDVIATDTISAASNLASPGQIQILNLSSGNNTITVPTGGTTPSCCIIIPPAANTIVLTLKGVNGDTGIAIHLTDQTELALATSVTTFVINAASAVTGMRLYWT